MRVAYFVLIIAALMVSCATPGLVTARPDPNAAGSGTLGSVRATDGSVLNQEGQDAAIRREEGVKK
ncbi:MAG: hypothetical protein P4L51_17205 [Puia sp.]|nr:hypothetical protein [Puia sp.]